MEPEGAVAGDFVRKLRCSLWQDGTVEPIVRYVIETGAPARNLVIAGDRVIVTTTEGTLEAFNLP